MDDTLQLTDEQECAMAAFDTFMTDQKARVFSLQGLAGTGKTYLLTHIAGQYKHAAICSLTGKAASVIRRKTGSPACTLHSYFYRLQEAVKDKRGRDVLTFGRVHESGALNDDLILLDESSMVSEEIAHDLLRTGAKILACGDPGELPPVRGNQYFSRADHTLEEIHRQALDSPIIRQAHAVREHGRYTADGPEFRLSHGVTDEDLRNADVVLCWTNRTKDRLNERCRRVRGLWQPRPQPGEPLVCLKNAGQFGVFNGGVYTLLAPFQGGSIHLDVDGVPTTIPRVTFRGVTSDLPRDAPITTTFDFGYAMTVHKSQGSEWDSVVLVDEYTKREQRHQWLYTAITRASQRILVVR